MTLRISKALPPLDVVVKRGRIEPLRPGEVAAIGWQFAPSAAPKWLDEMMARNAKKRTNRARYERMCRRAHQVGVAQ